MKTQVYCYYFPNWHVDELNEKWHGKGWTEWNVSKCAMPKFDGHKQPKKPLWGYIDESDPKVMEMKIDTACKYGIDGFIFDWYWYKEGKFRHRCLEEGFLKATNCDKMKFALMWCNHDATLQHPRGFYAKDVSVLSGALPEESFRELMLYCVENYFNQKNYIRVDDKIYFSIFNIVSFVEQYGLDKSKELLDEFREKVKKAGLGEMHINAIDSFYSVEKKESLKPVFEALKIDSVTYHGWNRPDEELIVEYNDLLPYNLDLFESAKKWYGVDVIPTVHCGWDCSPRTVHSDTYDLSSGYPYCSIVVNNTPEALKEALLSVNDKIKGEGYLDFLTITAWNEWTEGSYLEPEEDTGYALLEAVKEFCDMTEKEKNCCEDK